MLASLLDKLGMWYLKEYSNINRLTYTALSRLGARSVQENEFGNQYEML